MKHGLLITTLIIGLGGCAMSPEYCATLDWQTQGEADGADGLPARPGHWLNQCSAQDAEASERAYLLGWAAGNANYCQPDNGYKVGRKGREYLGVCQDDSADEFLSRYRDGHSTYLGFRIRQLRAQINQINEEFTKKYNTRQPFQNDQFKKTQGTNSWQGVRMNRERLKKELARLETTLESYN
ncbi:DUF2799 domain-containing protein [Gallaecimonas sp. GXIMD4217]|uniref:DUF2799 domain-containing protein n=1 Tax=Gallaecimonas sp. GXIMD4217 TaxID=3131927 RepID=UPI00311AD47E